MSVKYTFQYNGKDKTISIPDKVMTQGRKEGLTPNETIERYLSDEGFIVDETVEQLTNKAKANGVNNAGRVTGAKKRKAPVRKPDETKRLLIQLFKDALYETVVEEFTISDIEVTNIERIIAFSIGDDKYELTLSKKRKPKN